MLSFFKKLFSKAIIMSIKPFSKLKYWVDKLPELKENLEPLTQLMIRTAGETYNFIDTRKERKSIEIVNSKYINLLHSIDRQPALDKLKNRVQFLKDNKTILKHQSKINGFIDLTSDFFLNSPFQSINAELIAEINKTSYLTLSGVGRIAAIKIVFPEGINVKIEVGKHIDNCLKKRLVAVNSMFIYSNRFDNLKRYSINEKEIILNKRIMTKKCHSRKLFIKKQSRRLFNKIIPLKGGGARPSYTP